MSKSADVRSGRVATEGADLYYEVYGAGEPLLMIPPAGGDGWSYSAIASILSDEYRVITYDRRGNARSTMTAPLNFEISQQSRDALAVLHALGETAAFVFGNSSGAVIALDLAKTAPRAVRAVVAHDPPLARVHPNARKWQRFFARVYATGFRLGTAPAALRFMLGTQLGMIQMMKATKGVNQHRMRSAEPYLSRKQATAVLVESELLPVTNYLPDIDRINDSDVTLYIAASEYGLNRRAWYAEVAEILAEKSGRELVTFPGHHGSYMDAPVQFAAALREVLHKAERR